MLKAQPPARMTNPALGARCRVGLTVFVQIIGLMFAAPAKSATLVEVLRRIAAMGPSPLGAVMMNASVNAPLQTRRPSYLQTGQNVVIGYDPNGAAVTATATSKGVLITPAQTTQLATGLSAGLYPVGSQLYAIPPAGQLSLYQADLRGMQLEQATSIALASIDGSIHNILTAALFPDLAKVQIHAFDASQQAVHGIDMDKLSTTVLGAVNSGIIINEIRIGALIPDGAIALGTDPARIGQGAVIQLNEAMAGNATAISLTKSEIGTKVDVQSLILNLAHSASGINAQVVNLIDGQSATIKSITTTALGSVNDGRVFGE